MEPTNHHLTITLPDGKHVRARVVAVKRLGPGVANLLIETHNVLHMGEYPATYHTPSQEAAGTFKVFKIGAIQSSDHRKNTGKLRSI